MPEQLCEVAATPGQWALAARYQKGGVAASFNVLSAMLTVPFAPATFVTAAESAVASHAAFGADFFVYDDHCVQRLRPERPIEWTHHPVPGHSSTVAKALAVSEEQNWRPFLPIGDARVRIAYITVGGMVDALVINCDHLVTDTTAHNVLLRDIARCLVDPSIVLDDDCARYAHYYREQAEWLAGPEAAKSIEWWAQELQGLGPHPTLPLERLRGRSTNPAIPSRQAAVEVPLELSDLVVASSIGGPQLWNTVVTVALHQLTCADLVSTRMAVANRREGRADDLLAWTSNTVLLRTGIRRGMTWTEALRATQKKMMNAFRHGAVPRHELVRRFAPEQFASARDYVGVFVDTNLAMRVGTPTSAEELPFARAGIEIPGPTLHGLRVQLSSVSPERTEIRVAVDEDVFDQMELETFCGQLLDDLSALMTASDRVAWR